MVTMRRLMLPFVADCSSGPTRPLSERERPRTKELSALEPGDFLECHLETCEATSEVDPEELVGRLAYRRHLRAREVFSAISGALT